MIENEEPLYDYYDDNAEAVVYMFFESGRFQKNCLYVMKRSDAVKFCSHDRTRGKGRGGAWCYAFTTYRRNWRETPDDFRLDDGRFEPLLKELGITPIWVKGRPVPPPNGVHVERPRAAPVSKDIKMEQLSLLNF